MRPRRASTEASKFPCTVRTEYTPTVRFSATTSGEGGTFGVLDYGSSPIIKQSTLIGSTHSLIQGDCGTVKVADTQLVGPVTNLSATGFLQCIGNYDENLAADILPVG